MKIVNRKEFLELPRNTLYCKFSKSDSFYSLNIKLDTIANDWYYLDLNNFDDCDDSEERYNKIEEMIYNKKEYPLSLDTEDRDGFFEENQLFCIYDKKDIQNIIDNLTNCL